jgi:hypothetical protein
VGLIFVGLSAVLNTPPNIDAAGVMIGIVITLAG